MYVSHVDLFVVSHDAVHVCARAPVPVCTCVFGGCGPFSPKVV
jgi:hypothetical protein